jgi:hypothetical protein
MGACETTPPTTHPGTAAPNALPPAPDYQPPLTGVQLVRPRRYAAAGAPAGPRPHGSHLNAATGERPTNKRTSQPGNHTQVTRPDQPAPRQKRPPWVYFPAVHLQRCRLAIGAPAQVDRQAAHHSTRMVHRGPGALARRPAAVSSSQPSVSASAMYAESYAVTLARNSYARRMNGRAG